VAEVASGSELLTDSGELLPISEGAATGLFSWLLADWLLEFTAVLPELGVSFWLHPGSRETAKVKIIKREMALKNLLFISIHPFLEVGSVLSGLYYKCSLLAYQILMSNNHI